MIPFFFIALSILVFVAGAALIHRRRAELHAHSILDDDQIRQIEEFGTVAVDDEPLDFEEIEEEEERFWAESWDEPEEGLV